MYAYQYIYTLCTHLCTYTLYIYIHITFLCCLHSYIIYLYTISESRLQRRYKERREGRKRGTKVELADNCIITPKIIPTRPYSWNIATNLKNSTKEKIKGHWVKFHPIRVILMQVRVSMTVKFLGNTRHAQNPCLVAEHHGTCPCLFRDVSQFLPKI